MAGAALSGPARCLSPGHGRPRKALLKPFNLALVAARSWNHWIRLPPPQWLIGSTIVVFIVLAILIFFFLPQWMVADHDFQAASQRIKAENDIRTIGLQLLGGAVLALGALFTAINLVFNRESQITERFTRRRPARA